MAMRLLWEKRSISMNDPSNEDDMPWVAYIVRILPRRDGPRLCFLGRSVLCRLWAEWQHWERRR